MFVRLGWADSVSELAEHYTNPELVEAVKKEFPNPTQGWMQLPMKDVVARIEPFWDDPRDLRTVVQLLHRNDA